MGGKFLENPGLGIPGSPCTVGAEKDMVEHENSVF
jgi:hypothetical protein